MIIVQNLLEKMVEMDASDLYLTVGCAPSLRIDDRIMQTNSPALTDDDMEDILNELLDPIKKDEFESTYELNIALVSQKGKRFRANFYKQQHHTGIVIRRIKTRIPKPSEIGLPEIYTNLIMEKRGLVLVVGATGAGKSTSLAAMLGHRNDTGSGHIITVEDPIEFVHEHKKCLFTQREIGIDTYSYGIALKNALRQCPDIIVIGEIRDRETMENAMLFCEAGHLCLATLHSTNSNLAIERMVNLFPKEMQKQVFLTLSQNLKAILSQRLVESKEGTKRALAVEILLNTGLMKSLIEEGKIKEMKDIMEKSRDQGMQTFDQGLFDLVIKGKITIETAMKEADNPNNLRLKVSQDRNLNPALAQFSNPGGTNTVPISKLGQPN